MARQWYYTVNREKAGPVSDQELKSLAYAGILRPSDLVWTQGMVQWAQASRIKGLFPHDLDVPPPVPPEEPPEVPPSTSASKSPPHRPEVHSSSKESPSHSTDAGHVQLACPSCGAKNRVPIARMSEGPVCGRCRAVLCEESAEKPSSPEINGSEAQPNLPNSARQSNLPFVERVDASDLKPNPQRRASKAEYLAAIATAVLVMSAGGVWFQGVYNRGPELSPVSPIEYGVEYICRTVEMKRVSGGEVSNLEVSAARPFYITLEGAILKAKYSGKDSDVNYNESRVISAESKSDSHDTYNYLQLRKQGITEVFNRRLDFTLDTLLIAEIDKQTKKRKGADVAMSSTYTIHGLPAKIKTLSRCTPSASTIAGPNLVELERWKSEIKGEEYMSSSFDKVIAENTTHFVIYQHAGTSCAAGNHWLFNKKRKTYRPVDSGTCDDRNFKVVLQSDKLIFTSGRNTIAQYPIH